MASITHRSLVETDHDDLIVVDRRSPGFIGASAIGIVTRKGWLRVTWAYRECASQTTG
jgi:hypothetical protein